MFGIGMQELLLILGVALIVVGPSKLPDLAKSLGKGLGEFRKATDDIKSQLADNETFQDLQGIKNSVQDTVASIKPSALLDPEIKPRPASEEPELKKFEPPAPDPEPATGQAPLEPKAPQENLEARLRLMDDIIREQDGPAAPAAPTAQAEPASPAPASPATAAKTPHA